MIGNPMEKIIHWLLTLMADRWWGTLEVRFEDGAIKRIEKRESIRVEDL